MSLTIGNWLLIAVVAVVGLAFTAYFILEDFKIAGLVNIVITVFICIGMMFGISWYHNNTASGERSYKDYTSNMSKGLEREITITAEDGREIFHYEGKIDVEVNHSGNANYILFESEEGLRYIIYYGITDTVLIVQKGAK